MINTRGMRIVLVANASEWHICEPEQRQVSYNCKIYDSNVVKMSTVIYIALRFVFIRRDCDVTELS